MFNSSTEVVPAPRVVPRHVAIIMDGNGRWARARFLPRVAGHRRGLEAVRETVKGCVERGVEFLTLFAFSSENWRRPADEVSVLQQLFRLALEQEVSKLHETGIRLRVIGDLAPFGETIAALVRKAEALTAGNSRLTLSIAANYGGRWDLMQAINRMTREPHPDATDYSEQDLARYLAMSYAPEPDLFVRTGGEQRISNFLLWQLAYTELYFTPTLWPDFGLGALDEAIASYRSRERRFGRTSDQILAAAGAAPQERHADGQAAAEDPQEAAVSRRRQA
ncbi:MAG: di-trans,poly-cis-decaprenylcistransferase [Burkholderiales bacterium]|nr:di-trans,poly-cis-decaprenylcistransferase [Burkholderiales bacterium]